MRAISRSSSRRKPGPSRRRRLSLHPCGSRAPAFAGVTNEGGLREAELSSLRLPRSHEWSPDRDGWHGPAHPAVAESEPSRPCGVRCPPFPQDDPMLRSTLFALMGALSLTACAAEPSGAAGKPATKAPAKPATAAKPAGPHGSDALIRQVVAKAVPGVPIDSIRAAPVPGFREVALTGRVVYVSDDGKHLF